MNMGHLKCDMSCKCVQAQSQFFLDVIFIIKNLRKWIVKCITLLHVEASESANIADISDLFPLIVT